MSDYQSLKDHRRIVQGVTNTENYYTVIHTEYNGNAQTVRKTREWKAH